MAINRGGKACATDIRFPVEQNRALETGRDVRRVPAILPACRCGLDPKHIHMLRGSSEARDMIGTEIVESDRDANVHRSWSDCSASIALSLLSRAKLSRCYGPFPDRCE